MSAKTENWTCKCSSSGSNEFVEVEKRKKENRCLLKRSAAHWDVSSLSLYTVLIDTIRISMPLLPAESSI